MNEKVNPMSKFCPNCGTQLEDDAKFCMKCGLKLNPGKKKTNKRYMTLAVVGLVVIGAVGFFAGKTYMNQQTPPAAQSEQTTEVPSKQPETTTTPAKADKVENDTIDVTYTGGKTTQLHLSQNSIEMHVGQQLHLYPGDDSGEGGLLRTMTDGNRDKMGIVTPKGCVSIAKAGRIGGKGSSTEKIITANAPGEAVFTIVPNYGAWENAVKIYIRIVQ